VLKSALHFFGSATRVRAPSLRLFMLEGSLEVRIHPVSVGWCEMVCAARSKVWEVGLPTFGLPPKVIPPRDPASYAQKESKLSTWLGLFARTRG